MATQSESASPLDKFKRCIGGCFWTNTSRDSKNVIPLECESKHVGTTHLTLSCCESLTNEEMVEIWKGTTMEDEIERFQVMSKVHWSQLTEHHNDNEEVAKVSNEEVFTECLQGHPTWGHFFRTFGDSGVYDYGELFVGEKFAEGGQAELYHAHVIWKDPKYNSHIQECGLRYVFKVFRKGTFLRDLKEQWPQGFFRHYKEFVECERLGKFKPYKYICDIKCGTLLLDGRFGFLLVRETEDLRTFIDYRMKARTDPHSRPYRMEIAFRIIYDVATGMNRLHNLDIVHRDLKASNVLLTHFNKKTTTEIYVADFECSIGVVGTGFFRAQKYCKHSKIGL